MTLEFTTTVEQCAALSLADKISFPEVVGKLASVGVERYHADYCRHEITYYNTAGESVVVASPHPSDAIADEFAPDLIEQAVRQSQRGEHTYLDFIRKTKAAGCVGYFVQIIGRRAIYFGRIGDCHVERFPTSPSD